MSSLYNMHLGRARTLFEEQLFQLRIKNLLHLLLYVGCCEVRDPMLKFHELEPNNLRNSRSFPISANHSLRSQLCVEPQDYLVLDLSRTMRLEEKSIIFNYFLPQEKS